MNATTVKTRLRADTPSSRRQFIRLVGGGAVFAATASIVGCSSELPAEALASWKSTIHNQTLANGY